MIKVNICAQFCNGTSDFFNLYFAFSNKTLLLFYLVNMYTESLIYFIYIGTSNSNIFPVRFVDAGPYYAGEDMLLIYTVNIEERRHLSSWDWVGLFRLHNNTTIL